MVRPLQTSVRQFGKEGNLFHASMSTKPVDGTDGSYAGIAGKGALVTAMDTGYVYKNTGTLDSPVWISNDEQLAEMAHKSSCDFLFNASTEPWIQIAINSGSVTTYSGDAKHPGCLYYNSHASNANSGGGHRLTTSAIVLGGCEKATFVFKTGATLIGVLRRMGFHDTITEVAPVDGVYIKQDGAGGNVLTGHCVSNSVASTTSSSYTISANTWYRAVVELNADATLATFALYADDSETVLWSDTLSTNIPKTVGREVGHGDICTLTSPSSAVTIGLIDYIDIVLPKTRRV